MTLYHSGETRASTERALAGDWWKTPYGRWRLSAESEAMRRFPGFKVSRQDDGRLAWAGVLRSTFNKRRRYVIKVTYPRRFPFESPVVVIDKPVIDSSTPHMLSGGRPCLYRHVDGSRNGYDPARTTAATLVAWTSLWIHAYETWKATGTWPGRGV